MFFVLSKVLWAAAEPLRVVTALVALGLVGLVTRRLRLARWSIGAALAALLIIGLTPLGPLMMRSLEDRFPAPRTLDGAAGIIVLGGVVNEAITAARGQTTFTEGATRMTQAVLLARRFPHAALIFTGGSGHLGGEAEGAAEADAAERFFREEGLAPERLVFERRSRNTYENAVLTRDLVRPQAGQRWLLVTSAFHMPRSMGVFRRAGFDVIAYPTDYRTFGDARDDRLVDDGFRAFEIALREYIGLAAYWATGKTDALFPH